MPYLKKIPKGLVVPCICKVPELLVASQLYHHGTTWKCSRCKTVHELIAVCSNWQTSIFWMKVKGKPTPIPRKVD